MIEARKMKIRYNIPSVLMWWLLMLLPLFITGTASLILCVNVLCGIGACCLIGGILISSVNLFNDFLYVSFSGVSIFLGSLLLSLLIFIPLIGQLGLFVSLFSCSSVLIFIFRKRIILSFTLERADIIAFVIGFIVMVAISMQGDLARALHTIPVRFDGEDITDAHFFTAMVASIRKGSIFNAAYEVGSPINYHTLGFFIPAFWANLFGISSHQALWALAMPFYKIVTFLLNYELLYFFFKDKVAKGATWFLIVAILLPVVLAPLHPLYLLKFDPKNFVFSGIGYILPGGNSPFTFTFPVVLITLLLFYGIDWKVSPLTYPKIIFALLLASIVVGKLPLYFVMIAFFAVVIFKRLVTDKEKLAAYLPVSILALALSAIFYKVFLTAQAVTKLSFKFGYLLQSFGDIMHRPVETKGQQIFMGFCILAIFLLWTGLRLAGLAGLYKSGNKEFKELATGSITALLACIALSLILHLDRVDRYGNILREGTFDILQFIRAGYYLLTVAAGVGIMYLFLHFNAKPYYKRPFVYISGIWFLCALTALVANMKFDKPLNNYTWFNENYEALKTGRYNDGFVAVNPFQKYHGIMLSSSDMGTYWTAMGQANGCYNSTLKNSYRWDMFTAMLQKQDATSLNAVKKEGVKYIFSTPEDSSVFHNLAQKYPLQIKKAPGAKWIYILN
jgi:hypothetical protein